MVVYYHLAVLSVPRVYWGFPHKSFLGSLSLGLWVLARVEAWVVFFWGTLGLVRAWVFGRSLSRPSRLT